METKTPNQDNANDETPRKPSLWWRPIKWILLTFASILLILGVAISIVLWLLTPEKLTPMVSRYSSDYVNAEINASRVELSFWSTFPRIQLDIDNLEVTSHSLDSLTTDERAKLPAYADTLATVKRFSGGINLWALMSGEIMLYNVELESPNINLVKYDDKHTNFDIVPESESTSDSTYIPSISINRFSINDGSRIRFYSYADTIDAAISLASTHINGTKAPMYHLNASGKGNAQMASLFTLPDIKFGFDGGIKWDPQTPDRLKIDNFTLGLNDVTLKFDTDISFKNQLVMHDFTLYGADININDVIEIIPEQYRGELSKIESDLNVGLSIELLKKYEPASDSIPSFKVGLDILNGSLAYENLSLREIKGSIDAIIKGNALDESTFNIHDLNIKGRSVEAFISGSASNLISDPHIDGVFKGYLNLNALPKRVWRKSPVIAKGSISGNSKFNFKMSDLTAKRAHFIKASGNLTLSNLTINAVDSSMHFYTHKASLSLGTNKTIRLDSIKADSLLMATIQVDTTSITSGGIRLHAKNLRMGAAAKNASAFDTTKINPIGASIKVSFLTLRSDSDSTRILLRNSAIKASLQRYKNESRTPLLTLGIGSERAMLLSPMLRVTLGDAESSIKMHLQKRPEMSKRLSACFDSLTALYPHLRPDSVYNMALSTMAQYRMNGRRDSLSVRRPRENRRENIELVSDQSIKSMLRWWKAEGSVKAKSARLFTPYFPVRNSIDNLSVNFSTDSVSVADTEIRIGKSDFLVNGHISNISKAITSRRGTPLNIDFDIQSDTIDLNQITSTVMIGSAYADRKVKLSDTIDTISDESMHQQMVTQVVDTTQKSAFIVPSNISGQLKINAENLLYADIWFQRIAGLVAIHDGAINLDHLRGYTPMGSMDITALYSAPTRNDLKVAAGIVVRKLRIHQFLRMMPEIDSILPLLNDVKGIITAEAAMTSDLDSMMNLKFHTLNMALKLSGDSLVLVDSDTFRKMAKWLMLKHKDRNMIDHMAVELMIRDSKLDLFPFVFDMDRYRFGVSGGNDLNFNYNYHIAVLKSPLPFKFGITIKGKPGDMKVRLGKARFNENAIASQRELTDTARINLLSEIKRVFQFGVQSGKHTKLMLSEPKVNNAEFSVSDTLTHADSLMFIQQGVIEAPPGFVMPDDESKATEKKSSKKQKKKKK